MEEPTVDTLKEQKQSGQLNKPLEMLLSVAHLLSGGRATPSGTHVKEQRNKVIAQDVRDDTRTEGSVGFNGNHDVQRNDKRNDIGLEHVLELDDLSAQDD